LHCVGSVLLHIQEAPGSKPWHELALTVLTVFVNLQRCIEIHISISCYSNTICFSPTGHHQVYKLCRKLLPRCHAATLCILRCKVYYFKIIYNLYTWWWPVGPKPCSVWITEGD
jgi:hypothetical protein